MLAILPVFIIIGLSSCTNEDAEQPAPSAETTCHYRMQFHAECQPFDNGTRAAVSWKDGARVYLAFSNGSKTVNGQATYKASSNEWDVYSSESLTSVSGLCEAVYFESPSTLTSAQASLTTSSVIFIDMQASYEVIEDLLIVKASLTPKTGRLRFKGNPGDNFSVSGLSYYKGYTFSSRTYSPEEIKISSSIGEDGYTQFYHVFFTDDRSLVFDNTSTTCFKSSFGANILAAGQSGYITIPTADNPGYWTLVNKQNLMPVTLPELGAIQLVRDPYSTSVLLGTSLVSDGNGTVSASGLVWSLTPSPTLSDHVVAAAPSAMASVVISGLTPETTYHVRAFATNEKGTAYSQELSFTTSEKVPDTDISAGGYDEEHDWDKK